MVRIFVKLMLFVALAACKDGDSGPEIITDPDLLPDGAVAIIDGVIICEAGDHSCRDGSYGTRLTKKQCEYLQGWELGDPAVFYVTTHESSNRDFWEITHEGIVFQQYINSTGEYFEIELKGSGGFGWSFNNGCRCQISYKNGLIRRVYVEPSLAQPSQNLIDLCATKEL